ncbi:MAG TPA: MlaD family protein [Candidatus Binataceae bacterium]|nr:MlaD family protein [Candidatus Binataceae bacterium]
MKQRVSPVAVGGFVLGAAALAIVAVMILWGDQLFTRSQKYVLYFSANVNGLRPGAAVKFKGVQVGYVDQIFLSLNRTKPGKPPLLTIPVVVALSSTAVVHQGSDFLDLDRPAVVKNLVADGLRGQLASESLLTGILYVSLDLQPQSPAHFRAPPHSNYLEIPTVPTPLEQVQEMAMRALAELGQLDLSKLVASLNTTIVRTGEIAGSPQLRAAIDAMPETIRKLGDAADSIQRLAAHTDREVGPTAGALRETSAGVTRTLDQAQATLKTLRATVGPGSPIDYQLGQTLQDLSQAARALRNLADYLDRNPSAIVRGRPQQR